MSVSLSFRPGMRVGGESIHGEVELHFPQVQQDGIEEVHVKLRGNVVAVVGRNVGGNYYERRASISIVRTTTSLWTKGSAFPSPGDPSNVLRIPFTFQLPRTVYPSAHYRSYAKRGMVGYSVEVVGVRNGLFNLNRRVKSGFPVVPGDEEGVRTKGLLEEGGRGKWKGTWSVWEEEKSIRRGIWGAFSEVKVQFKMPKVSSIPLFTNIPIEIKVTTTSKPVKRDSPSSASSSKQPSSTDVDPNQEDRIFPSPPSLPSDLDLQLCRHIELDARGWGASGHEEVMPLGGLGKSGSDRGPAKVIVREKKWVPCGEDESFGRWVHKSVVESVIHLTSSPSFHTYVMSLKYTLRLKVPFPGLGNNVEFDMPVKLTSGMVPPPDAYAAGSSSNATGAELPLYQAPAQTLDLPPSYWSSGDWDDVDEKKG